MIDTLLKSKNRLIAAVSDDSGGGKASAGWGGSGGSQSNQGSLPSTSGSGSSNSSSPQQNPSSGGSTEGYKELLKTLEETDKKYSTQYQMPKVDLPQSLGGEKVTYIIPTQEELENQAKQQLDGKYLSSKSSFEQKRQKGEDSIANSVTKAQYEAMVKRLQAEKAFPQEQEAAHNKALEQGLARSSISQGMQEDVNKQYAEKIEEIDTAEQANKELLSQQLAQLKTQTESALKALSDVYDAEVIEKVGKLLDAAYKQKQDALEYNNSLDAAESKYQITRQNALTAAEKEERQRLAGVLKLYEQLGASGVKQQAQLEKFMQAKAFFDTLSASDAKEMLNASGALQYYLGDYYSALTDYVNAK